MYKHMDVHAHTNNSSRTEIKVLVLQTVKKNIWHNNHIHVICRAEYVHSW